MKRVYATSRSGSSSKRVSTPLQYHGSIRLSSGEEYTPKPGSLITVTRAISARINQNFDGFPSAELKKAHKSFVGRPVFVNHNNEDERRTRGIIVDSVYKEADRDKYIELTIEIDAQNFPRLASLISTGELDSVSMGTDVKFTKCSYCANIAHDIEDFCDHVKYQKGKKLARFDPKTGRDEKVLVYESCHGLNFFEISYVFDPADETAINSKVYLPKKASVMNKEALGELTSPAVVETTQDQKPCPQCSDDGYDGKECKWCEYVAPPKELQDPDTMKSRVLQIIRHDPNVKEGSRMGATTLQRVIAERRLAEGQRRLAEIPSTPEEARKSEWDTDVTEIDSNPVSFEDARKADDTADVTKLEPSAGAGPVKNSQKQADFPQNDPTAPAAGGPAATAPDAGPVADDQSDSSSSIDSLPITWSQDESGQPYGSVDGTGLDIFVNEDMSWQVLPEGSDQPVSQGQGSTYEDCVQQAFQAAQSGGQGGDPSQQAPADPTADPAAQAPAPAPEDPTKVAAMKTAEGVPAASQTAKPEERTEVTDLPDYETIEDGGKTYKKDEYAHNAGDGIRKLDDSTAPEMGFGGGSFKDNNKKASVQRVSAVKALELVEAYIEHGIVPDNRAAKFAAVGDVSSRFSAEKAEFALELLAAVEKGHQRQASAPRNTVPRIASATRVPSLATRTSKTVSSDTETLFGV